MAIHFPVFPVRNDGRAVFGSSGEPVYFLVLGEEGGVVNHNNDRSWAIAIAALGLVMSTVSTGKADCGGKGPQHGVYLAGPLGFLEAGQSFQKALGEIVRNNRCQPLDPWGGPDPFEAVKMMPEGHEKRDKLTQLDMATAEKNRCMIEQAKAVLAVLDGSDVDSGTAAEIGYAFARGKVIIGYRGDTRLSSDNEGTTVNLQVEYFILESGGKKGKIVTSKDQIGPELQALVHCSPNTSR